MGVLMLIAVLGAIFGVGLALVNFRNGERQDFQVVATNFPAYDFARAVVGEENVKMLVPPGAEMHDFEPTTGDMTAIYEADLFVYNGGESERWAEELLPEKVATFKMMDEVELIGEHEGEQDEHIWTSPENAKKIVLALAKRLGEIRPAQAEEYLENAKRYEEKIALVAEEMRAVVNEARERGEPMMLIFGDRFPFLYFADEYGLEYVSAFPGCAHETEAGAGTVAELIETVKETGAEVVLKLELSKGEIAETIARETGARVLTFHSAQNVSKEDFLSGKTYVDILRDNLATLKEVFNGAS